MKYGFVRLACVSPKIKLCDCSYNEKLIKEQIEYANRNNVHILAFPELSITGASCGDLFLQGSLISSAKNSLLNIASFTKGKETVVILGIPFVYKQSLYNCSAVIYNGEILGIIPKASLNAEEKRYFSAFTGDNSSTYINSRSVPFGRSFIFKHSDFENFTFAVEFGSDINEVIPQSFYYYANGANIIINTASLNDYSDSIKKHRNKIRFYSEHLSCAYVFANSGIGESSTERVFSAHTLICERGSILSEALYKQEIIYSDVNLDIIGNLRLNKITQPFDNNYDCLYFSSAIAEYVVSRKINSSPFIPENINKNEYFKNILELQSIALAKRIEHTGAQKLVIGISGGLDSTLALLACVNALKRLNRSTDDIIALTMPCFGTGSKTLENAQKLCTAFSVKLENIPIKDEVLTHFALIRQNPEKYDVTFENAQARVRTLILMDIANKNNGLVIGTGDLSELALGWATYSGDHMSMYSVNASLPKTLIQDIVAYVAECSQDMTKRVLLDILDTPISPELLPSDTNELSQRTEDLVGPYELHDFFLYYIVKYSLSPLSVLNLATIAFSGVYSYDCIKKWLRVFVKRFFAQQFKRSCMPDGPQLSDISLSPRSAFHMPSDAVCDVWLNEIDNSVNM